jgi:hypothetical protein
MRSGLTQGLVPGVRCSVVDHLAPLRVTVGNGVLVQHPVFSPFAARLYAGRLCLLAERIGMSLDFREVAHAWVFRPPRRRTRELRLYDRDGRAVARAPPASISPSVASRTDRMSSRKITSLSHRGSFPSLVRVSWSTRVKRLSGTFLSVLHQDGGTKE